MRIGTLSLTALAACSQVDQSYEQAPFFDEESFQVEVEPILEEFCANPSCHGRPERPLRIFAPRRFRADPERLFLDEPLTEEELHRNYESAASFAVEVSSPDDAPLLQKPLGEVFHSPGAVFHETDPEARIIEDWVWSGF